MKKAAERDRSRRVRGETVDETIRGSNDSTCELTVRAEEKEKKEPKSRDKSVRTGTLTLNNFTIPSPLR
ncbi:MAG: hypothetical protein QXM12_04970 [Nitrososphaerota archaeon]